MKDIGFELVWQARIPEIQGLARLYRYSRNGAEVLAVENDDENKVAGIAFRTPPKDSTGVAHILEHSVLCGSRKYPVKEPFVELLKGSVQTFLNAMTFPDKTCYPVASQNSQDLQNLLDVYLDAAFFPRITPEIFAQEGWHLVQDDHDPERLRYRGVVYNEMKGAYSSPDSLLAEYSQQSLFPNTVYGLDSGGHPESIPELTYERFVEFHRTHYHPSNARMFIYGNDDPRPYLALMHEYLQHFPALKPDSEIGLQSRFVQPRRVTAYYPADPENGAKSMLTMNWLLEAATDMDANLRSHILEELLIGMPASPLRKALLDSGLGEDLAGVGLEADLRQMFFSTGLKGIKAGDQEKVEEVIRTTLHSCAEQGFDPKTVEAAVNSVEFELRENNTGSLPRGLVLMIRALSTWLYDADPTLSWSFERPLDAIKAELQAGEPVFERMVRDYLLDNSHHSTVLLSPDLDQGRAIEKREAERLRELSLGLSAEEKRAIQAEAERLQAMQQEPDPASELARIPRLTVQDLPSRGPEYPSRVEAEEPGLVLYHNLSTNSVFYLDVGFDLGQLEQKHLGYVRLFGRALTEMGTLDEDYVSLSQRIQARTGGIEAQPFVSGHETRPEPCTWLFLRGKAMADKVQDLMDILQEVLTRTLLDNPQRFKQLVLEEKARMEQMLIPAGHQMVNMRLRSKYSLADWVGEHVSGMSYLLFLRFLADKVENNWHGVESDLLHMHGVLINARNMVFNVTAEEPVWDKARPMLDRLIQDLPQARPEPRKWLAKCQTGDEGVRIPAQVNYVGKAVDLYSLGYVFDPSSLVVTRYLRMSWLWDKIRVQGGAYGAFSLLDRVSGVMSFLSYRDPNITKTLEVYDQTADYLIRSEFSREEVEKAIIGTIGDMDAYRLPDAKGFTAMLRHLTGETDEARQKRREAVLATTGEDFRTFGQWLRQLAAQGHVVVLGDGSALDQAVNSGLQLDHVWQVL
ncbi:insulinase family protein [Desulfovermiculus halophilus]|uniref:insulinase family protein n=1 Tax=Desulfovermiculus halophilus TaxID=339722 RepID=UPI00048560AE|nr:insulinase family protein [Desulfovermiculus halophilus]